MEIKIVISNIAAAAILIVSVVSVVSGLVNPDNKDLLNIMIGASITYLFTENVVNGRSNITHA